MIAKVIYGRQTRSDLLTVDFAEVNLPPEKNLKDYKFLVFALSSENPGNDKARNLRFPLREWKDYTMDANVRMEEDHVTIDANVDFKTYLFFRCESQIEIYSDLNNESPFNQTPLYNGLCSSVYYFMAYSRLYSISIFRRENSNDFYLVFHGTNLANFVESRFQSTEYLKQGTPITFTASTCTSLILKMDENHVVTNCNADVEDNGKTIRFELNHGFVSWLQLSLEKADLRGAVEGDISATIKLWMDEDSLYPEAKEKAIYHEVLVTDSEAVSRAMAALQGYDKEDQLKSIVRSRLSEGQNSEIDQRPIRAWKEIMTLVLQLDEDEESFRSLRDSAKSTFAQVFCRNYVEFENEFKVIDEVARILSGDSSKDPPLKPINTIKLCTGLKIPISIHDFLGVSVDQWMNNEGKSRKPVFSNDPKLEYLFVLRQCILRFWYLSHEPFASPSPFAKLINSMLVLERMDVILHLRASQSKRIEMDKIEMPNVATNTASDSGNNDWWQVETDAIESKDFANSLSKLAAGSEFVIEDKQNESLNQNKVSSFEKLFEDLYELEKSYT
ncbi:hypothetical protein ACOME3_004270 [Neoechinorhynchus agilis]